MNIVYKDGKWHVWLWVVNMPVLIVATKSGIVYYNQVGGERNDERAQEGFLIPVVSTRAQLPAVFCRHWWSADGDKCSPMAPGSKDESGGHVWDDQEGVARQIESFFRNQADKMMPFDSLVVDRTKKNYEAWYHVKIQPNELVDEWLDAILTWENSD
jgi:hypothetical protein